MKKSLWLSITLTIFLLAGLADAQETSIGVTITLVNPITIDEIIVLENTADQMIMLTGWSFSVNRPNRPSLQHYGFPEGCGLPAGAMLRLHSGPANLTRLDTDCNQEKIDLVWKGSFVLPNEAGVVSLRDAEGNTVSQFKYPKFTVEQQEQLVNEEVRISIARARTAALDFAENEFGCWKTEVLARTEQDFFRWYFDYWNNLWNSIRSTLGNVFPAIKEAVEADIEKEFTIRVLSEGQATQQVESILEQAYYFFLVALGTELDSIRIRFTLSSHQWESYLSNSVVMVWDQQKGQPLRLPLNLIQAYRSKLAQEVGKIAGRKVSQFVGAVLKRALPVRSAAAGARFFGGLVRKVVPLIFGVLWEIIDYQQFVNSEKPKLRTAIEGGLNEIEDFTLHNPEFGLSKLLGEIQLLENGVNIDDPLR